GHLYLNKERKMKTTSSYDSSWTVDLVQTVASLADSLSEKTKFLEATTALLNAESQKSQAKQDDERRGYLMNDIYRVSKQLGMDSDKLRNLKAMTTLQLEAYAEELYRQLKNHPLKHLSVA
ncbi:hypothetical protein, partial [Nostoc sp. CHAB 5715]|uniref:hypothetical protein n=1 Tax=Nostoc sp. CHAB 5715 TaxID=2780400 RepID=UPI001E3D57B0